MAKEKNVDDVINAIEFIGVEGAVYPVRLTKLRTDDGHWHCRIGRYSKLEFIQMQAARGAFNDEFGPEMIVDGHCFFPCEEAENAFNELDKKAKFRLLLRTIEDNALNQEQAVKLVEKVLVIVEKNKSYNLEDIIAL